MRVPLQMLERTERRASQDRPGAASRRRVGSTSSKTARLKNLESLRGPAAIDNDSRGDEFGAADMFGVVGEEVGSEVLDPFEGWVVLVGKLLCEIDLRPARPMTLRPP